MPAAHDVQQLKVFGGCAEIYKQSKLSFFEIFGHYFPT